MVCVVKNRRVAKGEGLVIYRGGGVCDKAGFTGSNLSNLV